MDNTKIKTFMTLAGQKQSNLPTDGAEEQRLLGAQLLLSEVLEYVIKGLGVTPMVNGQAILAPNKLSYKISASPDQIQMLDGLCDVAYTMYWNAVCFGMPLEEGFNLVCDNNLEKFVELAEGFSVGELPQELWHCNKKVCWPAEVVKVEVLNVADKMFAVGKDASGKVRKPSCYDSVDLLELLQKAQAA